MATMLTDLVVRQASVPATGRVDLWDAKVGGLVLRVTATGSRSWFVFYRFHGINRRLTLGDYRAEDAVGHGLTLGEARKAARAALRDVDDGRDPQAEKVAAKRAQAAAARREGTTFAALAERWLCSKAAGEWRPKTRSEFGRIVERELVPVLGDLAPEDVTKKQIRTLYDRIALRSETMAKHTLAVLRLLYLWAADEDHVDAVPVFPRRGTQSAKRTRVLEEDELRAVCHALDAGIGKSPKAGRVEAMAEAFRLMLLTGQRRGEVLSMRWADITEERGGAVWWTIPAERHKGGRDHRVPLTVPAVEALKRLHTITGAEEYLFPAPKADAKLPWIGNPQKAAARLWAAVGLRGSAHVHDLRRTAATYMVRLGVPRLVVGKVLGHADTDVTGRYDKHAYDREKHSALVKWAEELQRIVESKDETAPAKVLPWAR
jgi:integrase